MTELLRWKEPRAALKAEFKAEAACYKPGIFGWAVVALLLYSGFRSHFATWQLHFRDFPIWLALYLTVFPRPIFQIPVRWLSGCALTADGVLVSAWRFIPWHQIDLYSITGHFAGWPIREVQILEKRRKYKWYQWDSGVRGRCHHFTFDSREVDEEKLRAIFAEYAPERETAEGREAASWKWRVAKS